MSGSNSSVPVLWVEVFFAVVDEGLPDVGIEDCQTPDLAKGR